MSQAFSWAKVGQTNCLALYRQNDWLSDLIFHWPADCHNVSYQWSKLVWAVE